MANKFLFASAAAPDRLNRENAPAYSYAPLHKLAQLAATGTLHDNVYASAEIQLAEILAAAQACPPLFVAKAAIYARSRGMMKDMPALLAAWLSVAAPDLAVPVFRRVIDNGRMLRSFVQIMRSGLVGRRSLGTRPKRLIQHWLEQASMPALLRAATGQDPSLADIVKLVHPRPADATRRAFYGWLIGRPYDVAALPPDIAAFEAWKLDRAGALPPVPFEWLTAEPLSAEQWGVLAGQMGWQALRMNLNTLARHGAFSIAGVTERVAARLADAEALGRARVLPYQVQAALANLGPLVPPPVRAALVIALDLALVRVPEIPGRVFICPDVSGSMWSPVTGYRRGASSVVRCVDVAALIAAAVMRRNPMAEALPFDVRVVPLTLDRAAAVADNAAKLAAVGGGGTNISAPLAKLNAEQAPVDLVIIVSDNQSWVDARQGGATATMLEWAKVKQRCPGARLLCIDLQPHGTTQAQERADILNLGGFSDTVFDVMARFASGRAAQDWVAMVEATAL